jgi:hypothetical protein
MLTKISPKISPKYKFICEKCDIKTNNKKDYTNHLLTAKHENSLIVDNVLTQISPKFPAFYCEKCDTKTNNKKDYAKHLLTAKHIKPVIVDITFPQFPPHFSPQHICKKCSKSYKTRGGLWSHLKKCDHIVDIAESAKIPEIIEQTPLTSTCVNTEFANMSALMLDILNQNTEFKNMLVEQNKTMIELASKSGNNNTVNSNNNFNLNLFLNDTCKDAINMNDFIQNMQISIGELENVGRQGYVSGISDIILNRIKLMDITKRPLHCTDVKRETMYIRDSNVWNKDSDDNAMLRKSIDQIARKNISKIPEWREQNPNCQNPEHDHYEFYIKMFRNSLGDMGDELVRLDTKIIKHITKLVMIDKNVKNSFLV